MNRIEITPVIKQILIACVVLFLGSYLLESRNVYDLNGLLAMHFPNSPLFKPWQIITHMFMHGGIAHLAFNMFALVSMGVIIEKVMGGQRFFKLYFYSGLGAIALHLGIQVFQVHSITGLWFPSMSDMGLKIDGEQIFSNGSVITSKEDLNKLGGIYSQTLLGASGAIYGVVVAFAFLFPNTELMLMFIPYPIKAKYLVPGLIAVDLVFGISNFSGDSIAHFAHIGGAITGLILVYFWRKKDRSHFW